MEFISLEFEMQFLSCYHLFESRGKIYKFVYRKTSTARIVTALLVCKSTFRIFHSIKDLPFLLNVDLTTNTLGLGKKMPFFLWAIWLWDWCIQLYEQHEFEKVLKYIFNQSVLDNLYVLDNYLCGFYEKWEHWSRGA